MLRRDVCEVVQNWKKNNPGKYNHQVFLFDRWLKENPTKKVMTKADYAAIVREYPLPDAALGKTITNFLGTGSNPNLTMTLSENGAGWNPFSIAYGHTGNVPYSTNPENNWSTWNITDDSGNYYGTITLTSDGKTIYWGNYAAPNPPTGYYLGGIQLKPDFGSFELSVGQIYQSSPFPNAPRATPAVYPGTTTPIVLSADGSNIVDGSGSAVTLKGVVRPSLEWNPQGQFLSPTDIQNMAKWGGNALRIDLNQNYWLNSGPVTQEGSYKQIVDAMIYYATQNNMAVILDLHWTEDGHQSPMANQDSITFWKDVAATYKNFGTVIFELFNEPYGIDTNTWLNGGTVNGVEYVGYQQLYDAVRGEGANNLVICNGLDYGYELDFVGNNPGQIAVSGSNIIYGMHPYNDKGALGYTGPGGSFDNNLKGILGNYPVIATEFGDNQSADYPNGYQTPYQTDLAYFDANNINYTAFAWWVQNDNPAFPTLISDWNGTPVNGGVNVSQDLQKNPPTNFFSQNQKYYDARVLNISRQLEDIQTEFKGVKQDAQRKETIAGALKDVKSFSSDYRRFVIDLKRKHQQVKKSHESQYGCLGSFIGTFWRSRTERRLADIIHCVERDVKPR